MPASALIPATLLVVSLILAGAMATGWASFGRPRHALSWSIAYALYAFELVMALIGHVAPSTGPVAYSLGLLAMLASAVMLVTGARQRVGLVDRTKPFAIAVAIVFLGAEAVSLIPAAAPYTSLTASLFAFWTLPFAIAAIRPRVRAPDAAEWAMIAALGAFMLYEALLIAAGLVSLGAPQDRGLHALYATVYLGGLVPVFVANGIAAVLLIASDLASRLHALASHDPLTGILNRRGFHDAALRAVANGRRQRQAIAVAIADIDHFKSINDRFGHTAGDRTLHYICGRLASGLRTEDIVGRIGGEEFALLLVNSTAEQAAQAMERIRIEVAAGYSDDGAPVPVTISFGVAPVNVAIGSAETALADALDEADRALYRSKVDGRNRTTLAAAA